MRAAREYVGAENQKRDGAQPGIARAWVSGTISVLESVVGA